MQIFMTGVLLPGCARVLQGVLLKCGTFLTQRALRVDCLWPDSCLAGVKVFRHRKVLPLPLRAEASRRV